MCPVYLCLGQLGTQACPPPGKQVGAAPGGPVNPNLSKELHFVLATFTQGRNKVLTGEEDCPHQVQGHHLLPLVKMPLKQEEGTGEETGPKIRSWLPSSVIPGWPPSLSLSLLWAVGQSLLSIAVAEKSQDRNPWALSLELSGKGVERSAAAWT